MSDGILLLDKPLGLSSNAALQRVRRAFGAEKAGHVGSLDPLATGMLPICLGEATKVVSEIVGLRKCYRFSVRLGERTATGDAEGEIVERAPVPELEEHAVRGAIERLVGRQLQVPPMYSALKRGGQPLYRLARAGVALEREARPIEIHAAALLALDAAGGEVTLEIVCSKGTYVRVLAEDVARALGTCGHVRMLRRVYVEPFQGERMHELEAVESAARAGQPLALLAPDAALPDLPAIRLDRDAVARVLHGQAARAEGARPARRARLYDGDGRFLGLAEVGPAGQVQPRRLLLRQ